MSEEELCRELNKLYRSQGVSVRFQVNSPQHFPRSIKIGLDKRFVENETSSTWYTDYFYQMLEKALESLGCKVTMYNSGKVVFWYNCRD